MAQWFAHEAERVYRVLHETDEDREHRQIIELIERKGRKITARELRQSIRRFKDNADEAEQALDELVHQMVTRIDLRFNRTKQGRRTLYPFAGGKVSLRPSPLMYRLVSRGDWI